MIGRQVCVRFAAVFQTDTGNTARVGPGEQVFLDGQVAKTMPSFHHLDNPPLDQFIGRQLVDTLALVFNRSLGDIAAFGTLRQKRLVSCTR